ncbi:ribosomal protein uL30-like [Ambystoma mexicanum]|uniref:ribosomal protein uL30-like n=1 Tax=Ambystoma mexicanum TaxID=8296 RepID=UPI0037E73B89
MEVGPPRKKIPLVPENLLKRRKSYQAIKASQAKLVLQEKQRVQKGKQIKFKRLETFLRHSQIKRRDDVRLHRMEKKPRSLSVPETQKLAFVIRITEIKGVCPRVRRMVERLRLRKIFTGVFLKLTESTLKMLRMIEPYVAWGYPNLKSIRELILKRGQAKINQKKVPLTDNLLIEKHLGKFGIICLEDLIHEVYSVGKNFREVSCFLVPFPLSVPRHAAQNKLGFQTEVGDTGNRADGINQLIRKLN